MKRLLPAVIAAGMAAQALFAQGTAVRATPTDWEEINFEFNQAVIVDGFPSMLRLADLLKAHPDYKVNIVGNADQIGSNRANDQLSIKRANAVAQFLQKYGANANQIQVKGDGKRNLEAPGRDVNSRFMNRRVVITVTAPNGAVIGEGSIASAIEEFQKYVRGQLGKIDDLLAQLKQMETELQSLKGDTGAIKQDTDQIKAAAADIKKDTSDLTQRPAPLTAEQTTQIARSEARTAADYALTQAAIRNRKYALVGLDAGPTFGSARTGNYSAEGFGKLLIPFGNGKTPDQPGTHAVQIDGDFVYFHKRGSYLDGLSDGIVNAGLVNRWGKVQLGTFLQFDRAQFYGYQGGATVAAGVATLDFVFRGGSIGAFGGKGIKSYGTVSTTSLGGPLFPIPAYIRYEDQVGGHAIGALGSHFYLEAAAAYKKRYARGQTRYPASYIKLVFPTGGDFALFIEGDYNTTFQNLNGYGARAVFGIQFGNWLRPSQYGTTQGPVPVDVPRPHYELLAR